MRGQTSLRKKDSGNCKGIWESRILGFWGFWGEDGRNCSIFAEGNDPGERQRTDVREREEEFLLEADDSFQTAAGKASLSGRSCRRWVDAVSQRGVGVEGLFWWLPLSQ